MCLRGPHHAPSEVDPIGSDCGPSSDALSLLSVSWSQMAIAACLLSRPAWPLERLSAQQECVLGVTPDSPRGP